MKTSIKGFIREWMPIIATVLVLAVVIAVASQRPAPAQGAAGQPQTRVQDVKKASVGPNYNTLLYGNTDGAKSATTTCIGRVISTTGKSIMLNFASTSGQATSTGSLSGSLGIWQGASTTVYYDSSLYGCDALAAYGQESTSTISAYEFR
jgi:hypothetical protein